MLPTTITTSGPVKHGALFQPGRIGRMALKNRFVQSPIFTQYAGTSGEVTDRLIEYFRERARGGAALLITENTSVDWEVGRTVGHPIRIDHDRFRSGLADLVEAVHNEGSKIAVQLHHTGRQNSQGNTEGNVPPIAPTADITSAFGTAPRAIELHEIPGLIEKYAHGARRAKEVGFDAVELHGAHGYLLQQFLSPKTNKRTDEYGGSLENRARFALEVVRAVREQVGPDYPVIYRYSVEEPYEGGLSMEDGLAFAGMLEEYVDALDVSAGNYDTAATLLPMVPPGNLLHYAKAVKKRVSVPVIGVGRLVWLLDELNADVAAGELDFVAMGRAALADPTIVDKTRRGETAHIRRCLAVNECISRWMFNGQRTQCVINPALSQEKRAAEARRPAPVAKRVLVVGAGPSGCEAAILAADRGHAVTLVDRAEEIGGQLRAWAAAEVLNTEISTLIAFYSAELQRTGVELRLGDEVGEADLAGYDAVLLATGTTADQAPEGSIDAVEMLSTRRAPDAERITVHGDTEIALFASLWLAEQGRDVTLSSPGSDVGVDTNDMQRTYLSELLAARNVAILTDQPAPSGPGVVWAQDRVSSDVMSGAVDDHRVRTIGTRARGGRMYEATQSGFWSAAQV
ncbi:FAD-dependent oxidoreductase [Arthrobacter sp. KK5.5]|uniref:oxidoreductase n=1 Tax=Arthrobacter sp. KK5.5 TaxID=3373084 RepID=UPI003EE65CE2